VICTEEERRLGVRCGKAMRLANAARSYCLAALALQPEAGTFRLFPTGLPVAAKRPSSADATNANTDLSAEQTMALVGMGLMQKMAASGELPWIWNEAEDGGRCDVAALRQRLELTSLALQTGAPLSTAEVTYLLGARPGGADVERGGLRARRISRNVWKLSEGKGASAGAREVTPFNRFNDGRRRFA
jgi:hypothetical protein